MKVLAVLLAILVIMAALGTQAFKPEDMTEMDEPVDLPQIICGHILADSMMMICYKALVDQTAYEHLSARVFNEKVEAWWKARGQIMRLAGAGNREKRLVDRCCYQPCYVEEIYSFC